MYCSFKILNNYKFFLVILRIEFLLWSVINIFADIFTCELIFKYIL